MRSKIACTLNGFSGACQGPVGANSKTKRDWQIQSRRTAPAAPLNYITNSLEFCSKESLIITIIKKKKPYKIKNWLLHALNLQILLICQQYYVSIGDVVQLLHGLLSFNTNVCWSGQATCLKTRLTKLIRLRRKHETDFNEWRRCIANTFLPSDPTSEVITLSTLSTGGGAFSWKLILTRCTKTSVCSRSLLLHAVNAQRLHGSHQFETEVHSAWTSVPFVEYFSRLRTTLQHSAVAVF